MHLYNTQSEKSGLKLHDVKVDTARLVDGRSRAVMAFLVLTILALIGGAWKPGHAQGIVGTCVAADPEPLTKGICAVAGFTVIEAGKCLSGDSTCWGPNNDLYKFLQHLGAGGVFLAANPDVPVWRLFNKKSGEHYYTTDCHDALVRRDRDGFDYQGYAFELVPPGVNGAIPLYRFFNKKTGKSFLVAENFEKLYGSPTLLGKLFPPQAQKAPLYRAFSRTTKDNFYTISKEEYARATKQDGYQPVGIVGFVEAEHFSNCRCPGDCSGRR